MASSTSMYSTHIMLGALRVILQPFSWHSTNDADRNQGLKFARLKESSRLSSACMNLLPRDMGQQEGCAPSDTLFRCIPQFAQLATVPRDGVKSKLTRMLLLFFGGALITVSFASAASLPATTTPRAATNQPSHSPASPPIVADIALKVTPLLADGVRLRRVALGCQPPAGAAVDQVAPGITRLNSRGFVVELRAGDQTLACSATVDAQRQILVATHDILQDQALSLADFELRWTDAFGGSMEALSSLPAHGPFLAATAIRAGDPLLAIQLTRPLAIRPGDLVTVLVKNGSVTVRTQLEARSSAAVGDSASVVNPETGLPLTVTVTGERTAELVMQ
jgi:flagella basal body P-ring formation protein FlgA